VVETIALNKKGLVEHPIYPCYKAEGKCQLRTTLDKFECVYDGDTCRYRRTTQKGKNE